MTVKQEVAIAPGSEATAEYGRNQPPCVIVHSLAQARVALAAGLPLTLLSSPGAAAFAGVPWWRALVAASGAAADILDCGQDGGLALLALRAGQPCLVLDGPFAGAVREAAARLGAVVLAVAPAAFDLGAPGAARHLASWLREHGNSARVADDIKAGLG